MSASAGVPAFPADALAAFYAALLGAFVLSLAIEARAAMRLALGQTLRLNED